MSNYKKKLIEVALPLEAINREAAREKSIRHGHPSTLHLWWARRPLAACRAVLFSSLVDDPSECVAELMADTARRKAAEMVLAAQRQAWEARKSVFDKAVAAGVPASSNPLPGPEPKLEDILVETERERLFDIIRELVKWENSNDERVLNKARAEILRSTGDNPPPVYDPFCGGGSIPLEAQRLGLEAHASDLNPVAVLITKALIEIPPKFAGGPPVNPESRKKLAASGSWKGAAGLAEDIRYYGQWMRNEAEKRIGHLYPKVKLPKEHGGGEATVIAWLWARTVASPNPAAKGAHVPLLRSFWLCTRDASRAWVEPIVDRGSMTFRFEVKTGTPHAEGQITAGTKLARGASFRCLLTGEPIPEDYLRSEAKGKRISARLIAIVAEHASGRIYLSPNDEPTEVAQRAVPPWEPEQEMNQETPNLVSGRGYGVTHWKELFTKRQITALTTLCDLIAEARSKVTHDSEGNTKYADAVTTYLAFALDKNTLTNCTQATWQTKPDRLTQAFGRQALPMNWDFAEANPLSEAGGGFALTLQSLGEVLAKLPSDGQPGHVRQLDATSVNVLTPALFSTDPPYYDNIAYADLSDFFYIWLRRSLGRIYPDLFTTLLVPKAPELVATAHRFGGDRTKARDFFEKGMAKVFTAIRGVVHAGYPLTVYYAFKQSEEESDITDGEAMASTGWETFLQSLVNAGFSVDGTWPMRTELITSLKKSIGALASSIVLVCRPRPENAPIASRRGFLGALKQELPDALRNLQKGNIAPVDLAQAAIGPGMAVFSQYARILEPDGQPMSVRTALALINQSLDEVLAEQEGEFDADTRWAVAWFDQHGFAEGPYGTAETLCTAKNTSVKGMEEAGILVAHGGKVRLLKKEELPAGWDPAKDKRITIWEITHQLLRRLDQGEATAAELIQKLGAKAEVARDLSYRLYTICERRKWASDAIAYNALVLSWNDVQRLAEERKIAVPMQGELI
jgi:putative DNA methylase